MNIDDIISSLQATISTLAEVINDLPLTDEVKDILHEQRRRLQRIQYKLLNFRSADMNAKEFTQMAIENAQSSTINQPQGVEDLETILYIIDGWQRKYCKNSQPKNYMRVTRIKPMIEGSDTPSSFWIQKLQLWVRGELKFDYPIDSDTYSFISDLNDWERTPESKGFETARWVNPKSKTV